MIISVYTTFPDQASAEQMAQYLLEHKLIACANIFPVQSIYTWQGKVENENEYVALVKSAPHKWPSINDAVERLHAYEVPCIVKYEVEANAAYEEWVKKEVE